MKPSNKNLNDYRRSVRGELVQHINSPLMFGGVYMLTAIDILILNCVVTYKTTVHERLKVHEHKAHAKPFVMNARLTWRETVIERGERYRRKRIARLAALEVL